MGLVVLDSVAANYRAEFEKKKGERGGAASLAKRGAQLVQLGSLLRNIARTEGISIVVANQVADRFSRPPSNPASRTTSGNSQGTERPGTSLTPHGEDSVLISPDPLALDHQQRWFTGWGDIQSDSPQQMKTPSLGLVWTNQLSCRIALIKQPVFSSRPLVVTVNGEDQFNEDERHITKWRRWFKVVFAPWVPPSEGRGVEFQIWRTGLCHVEK